MPSTCRRCPRPCQGTWLSRPRHPCLHRRPRPHPRRRRARARRARAGTRARARARAGTCARARAAPTARETSGAPNTWKESEKRLVLVLNAQATAANMDAHQRKKHIMAVLAQRGMPYSYNAVKNQIARLEKRSSTKRVRSNGG